MPESYVRYDALPIRQHEHTMYFFSAAAKELFDVLEINERDSDKDHGYQRALSRSRIKSISEFVDRKNVIAPAIVVSLRDSRFCANTRKIVIPRRTDSGWVIDGQHRLVGAANASNRVDLAAIAFLDLDIESQVYQFVTINKEAKGVPTSLYYDLLKQLPKKKKPLEIAKDKAADIAHTLRRDEESPLFNRITVNPAKAGHTLSLSNFVRKIAPLVQTDPPRSPLSSFTIVEQTKIIDNFFRGLREHEPHFFRHSPSIVFRTIGFGALLNALSTVFSLSLKYYQKFQVEDVAAVFDKTNFDFSRWDELGTGNAAELQAGKDLEETARYAFETEFDTENLVIKL